MLLRSKCYLANVAQCYLVKTMLLSKLMVLLFLYSPVSGHGLRKAFGFGGFGSPRLFQDWSSPWTLQLDKTMGSGLRLSGFGFGDLV